MAAVTYVHAYVLVAKPLPVLPTAVVANHSHYTTDHSKYPIMIHPTAAFIKEEAHSGC